ncbi:MAG: hypothetical protein ACR2HN_11035, partial [Tepidiformaceae bacterium]
MDTQRCGAPTIRGAPCRRPLRYCDIEAHAVWRRGAATTPAARPLLEAAPSGMEPPPAVDDRDLR